MSKLGKKAAFAASDNSYSDTVIQEGMSMRFYAACAAMQGIISATANSSIFESTYKTAKLNKRPFKAQIVKEAYEYADELLKQEDD